MRGKSKGLKNELSKKNGIYSITFYAQNKVKESNHKRRILSPGIRWQMTSPKELSVPDSIPFLCYKKGDHLSKSICYRITNAFC
ncbi:hypothetical protein ACT9SP_14690 [Bacillus cereus]|uniref:hypothetical protein n=1 Tax=Bacillus thuringiensis TaxID=1428 RepID=UPI0018CE6020|nr:hypothetical protein [Bacillus thuringiensis]